MASVGGANVSHYNSIIIRFSIYICEVFVFSRIYSSRVVSLYVNLIIYGLFCSGSCSLYKRYVNLLKMWSFMKLNIVFED